MSAEMEGMKMESHPDIVKGVIGRDTVLTTGI